MATDYVTQYLENTYLYESHDLADSTILEAVESQSISAVRETQVEINGITSNVDELCDNISFVQDVAEYCKYFREAQDFQRYNFSIWSVINETRIEEDFAQVSLYAEVSFSYERDGDRSAAGDNYLIQFARIDDQWFISDFVTEELLVYGITQETFDLAEAIETADIALAAIETSNDTISESVIEDEVGDSGIEVQAVNTLNTESYNKHNAVAYAHVYTTSTYTGSTGNNTSYMNIDCFGDYTPYGGNCQNYASQCVWAGFGGSNDRTKIKALTFPMDTQGSNKWHNDGNSAQHTSSWTLAYSSYSSTNTDFYTYAKNSNLSTGDPGLRSTTKELGKNENFSNVVSSASQLLGAVVTSTEIGHSLVIVEANGLARNQIKVCGNSPMRNNMIMTDSFGSTGGIYVVIPTKATQSIPCTQSTHTYSNHGYTSYTGCECQNCGKSRLKVKGDIPGIGVFKHGTSITFSGSAYANNSKINCYRMAMGIKKPDGTTTWSEVTNQDTISRTFVPDQIGLYTITIAARNMPESAPESVGENYIYTIRVW